MSERMLHKVLGWIGVGVVATAASLFASAGDGAEPVAVRCLPVEAYQTIRADDLTPIRIPCTPSTSPMVDHQCRWRPRHAGNNGGNTNGINAIGFNENDRFIYGWNNSVAPGGPGGSGAVLPIVGPTPPGMASVNAVVGDVLTSDCICGTTLVAAHWAIVNLVTNTLERP